MLPLEKLRETERGSFSLLPHRLTYLLAVSIQFLTSIVLPLLDLIQHSTLTRRRRHSGLCYPAMLNGNSSQGLTQRLQTGRLVSFLKRLKDLQVRSKLEDC